MKRASVSDAKNRLSALLDRVSRGETVIIEDRGVPVAELAPIARTGSRDRDRLARLERQGVLSPPRTTGQAKRLKDSPPRPAQPVSLSRLVSAEREEGW